MQMAPCFGPEETCLTVYTDVYTVYTDVYKMIICGIMTFLKE